MSFPIRNVNRTVGGLLSHHVTVAHGRPGLPDGTIRVALTGSAGQSFGAWLAPGVELALVGDANDYVGKGLSGGTLSVRPPDDAGFVARGERRRSATRCSTARPPARHSSAGSPASASPSATPAPSAVVEGVGDHGCEYMTGGTVVVLGRTGRNFAAGMSGGIAYVLDDDGDLRRRAATRSSSASTRSRRPTRRRSRARHRAPRADGLDGGGAESSPTPLDRERFVKVMPHDYKRALADLEIERDDHPVSTGGGGFFTAETEEAA